MRTRLSQWTRLWALAVFAAFVCGPLGAQAADPRIRQFETGFLAPIVPVADLGKTKKLSARMQEEKIAGLSIAVIDGGRVAWTKGFGVTDVESEKPVTADTLFLAGSISKPVAATGALRLVQEEKLQLDQDVNQKLRSWKVDYPDVAGDERVTLRRLLSHTAGLTVHGFAGYPQGKPVPSVTQVLDGAMPANSAAVRIDVEPGTIWRYSGGGYTVMQLLLEEVTERPFDHLLMETVLRPLGMVSSTFTNPLPANRRSLAASGHWASGSAVPGRWHTYPEMAAAGLWTTSGDLARWAIGVSEAVTGNGDNVLDQKTAQAMLEPHLGGWGLGPSVSGDGEDLRFSHGGRDAGFDAFLVALPYRGKGVAILINANNNTGLLGEVVNTVGRVFGWPGFQAEQRGYVPVASAKLEQWAGNYLAGAEEERINIRLQEGALYAFGKRIGRDRLYPESDSKFFVASSSDTLEFVLSESGVVEFIWRNQDGEVTRGRRQ